MKHYRVFLMGMYIICISHYIDAHEWTWLYRKTFTHDMQKQNAFAQEVFFTRSAINQFTQLVFSWNVLRSQKGYFSFFIQVRDAATKQWGIWHHMVDWGATIQKTYISKSDGVSSYVHVRLELETKKMADGFRLKVVAHDEASLQSLQGLYITTSNFNAFKEEDSTRVSEKMCSVMIKDVPRIAQFSLGHEDHPRMCSPVSCSMVMGYLTKKMYDPLACARGVFDTGLSVYGSWGCNCAYAFDMIQGLVSVYVKRCNSFRDIHQSLCHKVPVIVSVRGVLPGALKPFPHGHLLVVVGWDQDMQEVICHDPAAYDEQSVLKRYSLISFLHAWERSHRLVYMFHKQNTRNISKQP